MADYAATAFFKDGLQEIARSWEEHYQLIWDGWRLDGPAPAIPRNLVQIFGDDLDAAFVDHNAAGDPHSQYLTQAEVDTTVATHAAAADPHSVYQRESLLDADVATKIGDVTAAARIALNKAAGRVYTPEAYGAVGDGVADDTAAVVAVFAAANALRIVGLGANIWHPGATVQTRPGATYKLTTLSAPITVSCNVLGTGATLVVPNAYADTVLLVGHETSGQLLHSANIKLPNVIRVAPTTLPAGGVGVKVQNLYNSDLVAGRTTHHETGLWFAGLGMGTCYNRIHTGWVDLCKVSHKLAPQTGGWVNQNTFVGGNIMQSPNTLDGGLSTDRRRSGWKHVLLDGGSINVVQGNTFVGMSYEGNLSQFHIDLKNAAENQWIGSTRFEQGDPGQSVTVSATFNSFTTATSHGFALGDMVWLIADVQPVPLVSATPYYVNFSSGADFGVSKTLGGSAVDITTAGTNVKVLRPPTIRSDNTLGNTFGNRIEDGYNSWPGPLEPVTVGTIARGPRLGYNFTRKTPDLTFTPEQYGAIGDGTADDTVAVRACFTAANAVARQGLGGAIFQPGSSVILSGTYNLATLATPIDILCNVMESRAIFVVPDAYAGVAVRVGHTTSGSYLQNAQVNLPDVMKSSAATIVAGSVGVKTLNIGNSVINFSRTGYFETGVWLSGLGQGTVYNTINIGWISYCKVSLQLKPETGGWVNQNTFTGGGIQQSPGAFGGGLRRSGWRHVVLDGAGINPVNGNTFLGVSLEGDVSEYTLYFANAYSNVFLGCRHEQGTAGAAVTVTAASATLTSTAHGMAVGDMVSFVAAVVPTSMFTVSPYYVVSVPDADTYTVSQKKGGTAVTFGSTGTSVSAYRPQKIYFDTSGTLSNNQIRNPALPTSLQFLELIKSTGSGTGNGVETAFGRTVDNYATDGTPPFRGRNRYSSDLIQPIFAAYPSTSDPLEDPTGWTAAVGPGRLLFAAANAETGRLTNAAGTLNYKANSEATAFEIGSMRRSPALITTISGLSLTASTTTTTTVTLTGASVRDHVVITPDANLPAGVAIAFARVSATDTITIGFLNITGSPISLTVSIQAMIIRRYL